jgi:hypothetical protein
MVSWTLVTASSQLGISTKEDITLKVCLLETCDIQRFLMEKRSVKLNRQSIFPLLMMAVGVLLILGAVAWYVTLAPMNDLSESLSAASVSSQVIPYPKVQRISLADAKAAYDLGNAIFVDVRGEPYYSQGHIPGALSIDEDELEGRLNELNPKAWIITYCT